MKDKRAEEVVKIFKDAGMTIEPGAHFSVKGQIAQLLNGSEALQAECECSSLRRQPAEQKLDLHLFAKRMDEELEKHDIQGFEPVVLAVAEEVLGYEQQPAPDATGLVEAPINVIYTDGVGAARSSPADCRDGVRYVTVGDTVYWPLSADDAQRLLSAGCGRGEFSGPASSAPDVTALVEALEEAYGTLERAVSPADETPEAAIQSAMFVIDAALAAHRKQGGEV